MYTRTYKSGRHNRFYYRTPKSQNERVWLTGVRRPTFNNVKTKQTKQNKVDLNLI